MRGATVNQGLADVDLLPCTGGDVYASYYQLSSDPFRLSSSRTTSVLHRGCRRVWDLLNKALQHGEGIVVVTGATGTGKTVLADRLLRETDPSQSISVQLVPNNFKTTDLLRELARGFGLAIAGTDRATLSLLVERHLVETDRQGRRVLVVIDEAHRLSPQSLESLRLLTIRAKICPVLQIVLFGQDELSHRLGTHEMKPFRECVVGRYRLEAMGLLETKAYIEGRLDAVDWRGDPAINGPAVLDIFRFSHGVPQHVDSICSRVLLYGCSREQHALDECDVMAARRILRNLLPTPLSLAEVAQRSGIESLDSLYELALVPGEVLDIAPLRETMTDSERQAQQPEENVTGPDSGADEHTAEPVVDASSCDERTRSLVRAISRL